MARNPQAFVTGLLLATTCLGANAFNPKCELKMTQCVSVQGATIPLATAEGMVQNCRDFTRRNVGARIVRMSVKELLDASGGRPMHPLSLARFAYDALHDSPINFDRRLPMEQRYGPVKRACGQVFRDMREAPPEEE